MRRTTHWTLGIIITAMYAFASVGPIGDLLGLPQMGFEISSSGWFWLIARVVLPPLTYVLALTFARKQSAAIRLMVLTTGLMTLALLQLQIQIFVSEGAYFVSPTGGF